MVAADTRSSNIVEGFILDAARPVYTSTLQPAIFQATDPRTSQKEHMHALDYQAQSPRSSGLWAIRLETAERPTDRARVVAPYTNAPDLR